jgi:hypothetical protein
VLGLPNHGVLIAAVIAELDALTRSSPGSAPGHASRSWAGGDTGESR